MLGVLLVACAVVAPARWALSSALDVSRPVNFDIPSLPLSLALTRYGEASGFAVLADSALTANQRSAAVQGYFSPQTALQRLLRGTGLSVRYSGASAFTVVAPPSEASRRTGSDGGGDISTQGLGGHRFAAVVQQGVLRALCNTSQARPGEYRAVLQLWLSAQGSVERVRLINSTGLLQRDNAILKQIQGLRLAGGTSMRLPQPLTVLILPGEGTAMACRLQDA